MKTLILNLRVSCAVLLMIVAMSSLSAAQQFNPATFYTVGPGNAPLTVVSADLDLDGNLDLAAADYWNSHISVLFGKGDGTFQRPLSFSVPSPIGLAVGDFNGDGIPDLAVLEYVVNAPSSLGILLGNGDGTFQSNATYTLGITPTSIVIADFDGDGNLDIAVTNLSGFGQDGSLMTFAGLGNGTFRGPRIYALPGDPYSLAAGDLNSDGKPDLAVAESSASCVAVLLNAGDGTFLRPVCHGADSQPTSVAIADLNHDGVLDLVLALPGYFVGIDTYMGLGGGKFAGPYFFPTAGRGEVTSGVVIADFNGDGNPDVVTANDVGASDLFYGNLGGQFEKAVPIGDQYKGIGGSSVLAADFNHDGAPDLAFALVYAGRISVLLNTGK
jgi:hypothetical protein